MRIHRTPSSGPYPFPALSHEPRIQQLSDDLAAAGYHPFHAPCGVMLNEADMAFSTCIRCGTCDGSRASCTPSRTRRCSASGPRSEPNVTLMTNARAVRLETDASGGAVTGVVVEHDGETETLSSDIVVVSCGAANSAKLLLASANDRHPNGLANGSDQVGRNYMFHNSQAVLALSKEPNPTVFQKTLGVNDFYLKGKRRRLPAGEHADDREVGGRHVQGREADRDEARARLRAAGRREPRGRLLALDGGPAEPENRVTLADDGNVRLAYSPSNDTAAKGLFHQLRSMLGHLGMHPDHLIPRHAYLKTTIPIAGVAHQAGTCRFGTDPATSVLDTNCRAHEVDNLYVVDTSFFPSIGAVNPALTAMANAIRVGEHLVGRMA